MDHDGGKNVIPYARQLIDNDDIQAVVDALQSDFLTTGPMVDKFERALGEFTGATNVCAVSSGTAALHAAVASLGLKPDDEVIVPAITFVATSNAVIYQGGMPVFCDVDQDTLLIDVDKVEKCIGPRTRAIIAVDYAGQPCAYDELCSIARKHGIMLIADACHSLGAVYKGKKIGTLADITIFSFHPVKHVTTGEGGALLSNNRTLIDKIRRFRNHGISSDHRERQMKATWEYEMVELGYNYRITDFQSALGVSQLRKISAWIEQRCEIAQRYNDFFDHHPSTVPLKVLPQVKHAYHLYVVKIKQGKRSEVFHALRQEGISANVHYLPVYLHPYYREKFGFAKGICPVAETAYEEILSLPIWHGLKESDLKFILSTLNKCIP